MASRKLNHLEIEEDFKLIGIHSQLEAYKLAFNLNKSLKVSLKVFDYKIKINIYYSSTFSTLALGLISPSTSVTVVETLAKPENNTLLSDRFIALHMI